MEIHDLETFSYAPACFVKGCLTPARYKAAAPWSDATASELKNYGLSCETHRQALLERARSVRARLRLTEGETVGPVSLYRWEPGRRDAELVPLEDEATGSGMLG